MAPQGNNTVQPVTMPTEYEKLVTKNLVKPVKFFEEKFGNYNSAILAIFILLIGFYHCEYIASTMPVDQRTATWFWTAGLYDKLAVAVGYILVATVWGPQFMKDRKPYNTKTLMTLYNMTQVILCAYMTYEFAVGGWFTGYSFRCQTCDYSMNPRAIRMARAVHLYFLSKALDLLDTGFFIARKKFDQISFLHVIHHSTTLIFTRFCIRYFPGGHMTFMCLLNCFIHTVMYTYYLLSGLGPWIRPYLWWKRYLTQLQIIQFILVIAHSAQVFIYPCPGGASTAIAIWSITYLTMYLVLFLDYYRLAYKKGQLAKKALAAEGTVGTEYGNGNASSLRPLAANTEALRHRSQGRNE